MSRTNTKSVSSAATYEGAKVNPVTAEKELRRSVMACLLWEDQFYESGEDIATRISGLIKKVPVETSMQIAVEARNKMKLRHIPLFMAVEIFRAGANGKTLGDFVNEIVQRPDEISELLALLWKDKPDAPIPKQFRVGLSRAFNKFNEYQLAKYNQDRDVKLRDALFMCHPKPKDEEQARLFKALADKTLMTPDTWETNLSAGKDKKETFERLMNEKKLGGLAFLRNLRKMQEVDVGIKLIKSYFKVANFDKVLPFRFISAARFAPLLESEIEAAMIKAVSESPKLKGHTVILVDNSGSMYNTSVSKKSDLDRSDAAIALAILLKEVCESSTVLAFSNSPVAIPTARRGFALRDAIKATTVSGTDIGKAVQKATKLGYDRIIIVTDEQSSTVISPPKIGTKGYCINVASYENGIGYGPWVNITGWSESIVHYIQSYEADGQDLMEVAVL